MKYVQCNIISFDIQMSNAFKINMNLVILSMLITWPCWLHDYVDYMTVDYMIMLITLSAWEWWKAVAVILSIILCVTWTKFPKYFTYFFICTFLALLLSKSNTIQGKWSMFYVLSGQFEWVNTPPLTFSSEI